MKRPAAPEGVLDRLAAWRRERPQITVDAVVATDRGGRVAVARSAADAPEIDGVLRIAGGGKLQPGSFVPVVATGADERDLAATLA